MKVRGHTHASAVLPSKRGVPVTHLIELSLVPRFSPDLVLQMKKVVPC